MNFIVAAALAGVFLVGALLSKYWWLFFVAIAVLFVVTVWLNMRTWRKDQAADSLPTVDEVDNEETTAPTEQPVQPRTVAPRQWMAPRRGRHAAR